MSTPLASVKRSTICDYLLYRGTMRVMDPLVVHFLISLIFVVKAVSSTAQWNILRPADMTDGQIVRDSVWLSLVVVGRRQTP